MHDIAIAFVWHQHQPYYSDDLGTENPMPWVRLHGTKDYWGMAMHLKEVPELCATINLVPSLLDQILAYTDRGASDAHLRVSRLPPDGLNEADMVYLLDNFFMAHHEQMVRPYPRFAELYQKRGWGIDTALRAAKRFTKRDILDLQCWSNLTWIHPIAFEIDADLAAFRDKGGHYTPDEKDWLLDRQMDLLREVIPLHKELADRGQLELTTTPFYHPIMPLLWDKRLARQAMPDVALPNQLTSYPEDVHRHLAKAVAAHKRIFGSAPRGLWPSEGSVCQEIIPAIVDAGIQWIAADEEILSCSTNGWVARDGNGFLRNPEMLYRPWRVEEQGKQLQIIFRDHAMSDQIGFHYQRFAPEHAVGDFISKLEAIGHATRSNAGERPTLVSIILDGENCWEYYPNGGVEFLRKLYQRIVEHQHIKPVRVGDHLQAHPAGDRLGRLFAGSWIQHNFAIWIGHPECNRAWDLLHAAREHLLAARAGGEKTKKQLELAQTELDIAEGSDWFWWFGDDHSSSQDRTFDRLFRLHLQNIYTALGDEPPLELTRPISHGHGHRRAHTEPTGLLNVKIDGRRTYFEWLNAGECIPARSSGTMAQASEGIVAAVHFGFDTETLFVRVDARDGAVRQRLADVDTVRLMFTEPGGYELLVGHPDWQEPLLQLYHEDVAVADSGVKAAADAILELAIPFRSLGTRTDSPIQFHVELLKDEQPIQRIPSQGAIELTVPSPDYELIMWQA